MTVKVGMVEVRSKAYYCRLMASASATAGRGATATVVRTLHAQRGRRAGKNAMGRSCSAARLDEDSSDEAMVVVISLVPEITRAHNCRTVELVC